MGLDSRILKSWECFTSAPGLNSYLTVGEVLFRMWLKRLSWTVALVVGSILVAGCLSTEAAEPVLTKVPAVVTPTATEVAPAAPVVTKMATEAAPVRTLLVTKAPPVTIERPGDVTQLSVSGGIFVGESTHEYAIAYHPQSHLFYADGWYAQYYDGSNSVLSYSKDGTEFTRRSKLNHVQVAYGPAAYFVDGHLYVVYPDSNHMKIFLRRGTVDQGSVSIGAPREVIDMERSFMANIPSLAFDAKGVPHIVFSSLEGWGQTGCSRWRAWIANATSNDLSTWSEPLAFADLVSPTMEAGASTSVVFVGGDVALAFEALNEFYVITGAPIDSPSLGDTFKGTHDYALVADGDRLHIAYFTEIEDGGYGAMVYRTWSRSTGWSQRFVLGTTSPHHTALALDNSGNVWVFYGERRSVRVQVLRKGSDQFEAARCPITILDPDLASHAWLNAAAGRENTSEVGLLWIELPSERWNVRFRRFTLDEVMAFPTCAA